MTGRIRRLTLCAVLAATSVPLGLGAQSVTGVVPNWGDLETWARAIASTREVEHGLGLQLSGTGGVMLLSFSARLDARSPAAPAALQVVMAPPLMGNPNLVRTPSLVFLLDEGTEDRALIDATGSVRVDDAAPGAIVRSATGRLTAGDFARLAKAKTVKATVFGSQSLVRIDQLKAIQALATRLLIKTDK
jgi:hypothetical protein